MKKMLFRIGLAIALLMHLSLGIGYSQDVKEWDGQMFFRPVNPQIRFSGTLLFQNKTNSNQIFSFGTATAQEPHLELHAQTKPIVASCTTGSVNTNSNDTSGVVTNGTGARCTIVFAVPWTNAPVCMANDVTSANALQVAYTDATSVEIRNLASGDQFNYHCFGSF